MPRDEPRRAPSEGDIAALVESRSDRQVSGATAFAHGLNAVYRVEFETADPMVVKTATFVTDDELLTEAALLERLAQSTDVPLPSVLATLEPGERHLEVAAFVMEYCPGRAVGSIRDLSPTAQQRLIAESGDHLASLHNVAIDDGFGPLRVHGDHLIPSPRYASWTDWFRELVDEATAGLRGEGFTTDSDPRFADLVPEIRQLLTTEIPGAVDPAVLLGDYRTANLRLADDDTATPLIQAVVDIGCPPLTDGLLDLALVEDALVDIPFGGTDRADHLRHSLREHYRRGRSLDPDMFDSDRYAVYRLYARARRMGHFEYWYKFARADHPDAVADRWRAVVRERICELT